MLQPINLVVYAMFAVYGMFLHKQLIQFPVVSPNEFFETGAMHKLSNLFFVKGILLFQ